MTVIGVASGWVLDFSDLSLQLHKAMPTAVKRTTTVGEINDCYLWKLDQAPCPTFSSAAEGDAVYIPFKIPWPLHL